MDMLGSEESSLAILKHYHDTNEDEMIAKAVKNVTLDQSTQSVARYTTAALFHAVKTILVMIVSSLHYMQVF